MKINETANITKACIVVGISRQTHYYWFDSFDSYKKGFEEIEEYLKKKY